MSSPKAERIWAMPWREKVGWNPSIKRFPEDFMFQLTKDECLRSQIATLNEGRGQHLKYMPYVFTENGVAMLSSILRSDTAIEVNIRIMRAFTSMRNFLQNNAEVFQRLSTMEYHQLEMQQHLRPLPFHRRWCISHRSVHQGLGQKVVRLLKDGDTYTIWIGGTNQQRVMHTQMFKKKTIPFRVQY